PAPPERIVSLDDAFVVRSEATRPDRLEKRITRAYLEWYCSWPQKRFVGCVDADGALTSYLIIEPVTHGSRRVLAVLDYFTVRPDFAEILGLVAHVIGAPPGALFDGDYEFLVLRMLGEDLGASKPIG